MTTKSNDLPELAEADAPADIRAIYQGLRDAAASPIAALIWRHIATHPGALEACWTSLAPVVANGRLAHMAWRVARERTPSDLLPRIEPRARPLLGISPDDALAIQALAEAYNRANPFNLLAVLTLLARIGDDAAAQPDAAPSPTTLPPPIERALPFMTPPSDMSPDVRWLLNDLRFGDTSTLDSVVPSLFRHLTGWPAYLAVLHVSLAPMYRDGRMADSARRVQEAMAVEAVKLAREISPVRPLADNPALQATMQRFGGGFIPMMVVVGSAMSRQFD